jgi:hypothetical protein
MTKKAWIGFTARERAILLDALSTIRKSGRARAAEIDALTLKLVHSEPHPSITVGVHGGQVQWVLGNPFPIRVCDYDGEKDELPDVDERGQPCRVWFEPIGKRTKSEAESQDSPLSPPAPESPPPAPSPRS